MWAPLMCPKHWTRVAMDKPKHREMRTRSAGGGFSFVDAQLMVDPKLSSTNIIMAKNSPETARQNSWVHTPLKAAIILLLHEQDDTHLLKETKMRAYIRPWVKMLQFFFFFAIFFPIQIMSAMIDYLQTVVKLLGESILVLLDYFCPNSFIK